MSPLAEPITINFDHDPLDGDDDLGSIRAALDRAHLVTIHAPTWSVVLRCGRVVRIEIDVDGEGITDAMHAVGGSSVWASLDGIGVETRDEVVVELVRDEDARAARRRQGSPSKLRFRIEICDGSLALVKNERPSNAGIAAARSP